MKYFLSLCAIIKDENNLIEFIIYHWLIGVEYFYIYDNDSKIPIKNILDNYIFKKICTIIDYPGRGVQMNAYNHCIKNYGNKTKWLCILDGDEYILPKKHDSLRDFLNEYKNYHAIGINWVIFGTSFHEKKQNGFVIDNYRYCSNKADKHIKTIFQPEHIKNCYNQHFVELNNPLKYVDSKKNIIFGSFNNNIGSTDIIQINHYFTKSLEDMYEKHKRGKACNMGIYQLINTHDDNNDIKDDTICTKYLHHLKKIYDVVNVNWEIYKLLNDDLEDKINTPDEYYNHLFKYGINENRPYKITDKFRNFNLNYYKNNYSDINYMNDMELEKHYIKFGFYENRICDRLL
jgi:hypothetical protein